VKILHHVRGSLEKLFLLAALVVSFPDYPPIFSGAPMLFNRRAALLFPVLGLLPTKIFGTTAEIGTTLGLTGSASLNRAGATLALYPQTSLLVGDQVETSAGSTAALELFTSTLINLGPEAQFLIDVFSAEIGGTVTVGGAMVLDRAEDLPKLDLTVQNAFAQIGVRGTRFFAGPSKGVYGVFVARGSVEVTAAGQTRLLGPGDGVDIASPGAAPGPVAQWKPPRIAEAFESVGLTP
jgi:hypothetical protein